MRIARAAAELGIQTLAVFSEDDRNSGHMRFADEAQGLVGTGVSSYLDGDQILQLARQNSCDAIHPGYGFLSESAAFAARCTDSGIAFVGPTATTLALLGDKARARKFAQDLGVNVLKGSSEAVSLKEAEAFYSSLDPGAAVMVKAVSGGGGRGMRVVGDQSGLAEAFEFCRSEAGSAFGNDQLYVEMFLPRARHIEVQIIGDGRGGVSHLWERECTLQRRNQKLVEIAPSPGLAGKLRDAIVNDAVRMAEAAEYKSLGTFEFLVDISRRRDQEYFFIEANPRLQVEHTVTEEVTGIDLVKNQIMLASGNSLAQLDLNQVRIGKPRGFAVQVRVNAETMAEDGSAMPAGGRLDSFEIPSGPGLRVDTSAYVGYETNPRFDSLLAKVVASAPTGDFGTVLAKAGRALSEIRIGGVKTNTGFLQALLKRSDVRENAVYTHYIDDNAAELFRDAGTDALVPSETAGPGNENAVVRPGPAGTEAIACIVSGSLVRILATEGEAIHKGQEIAIVEAMKMQYAVTTGIAGIVREVSAAEGEFVREGRPILFVEPSEVNERGVENERVHDLDAPRPDLAAVLERQLLTRDAARPHAMEKRHGLGMRSARENIDDLCDPDTFMEYGGLTFAAQRARRSEDDLIRSTPADGLVTGIGRVNGSLFNVAVSRCMILAYDFTVLAGTQGTMNHRKTDRMLALAESQRLPVVLYAEGGGGRPGDTDNATKVAGLHTPTFQRYARLSGLVPRIAIVAGRCFAGNAVLAGASDIIIATRNATLGMGGPAMIEGGGLGVYSPDEVGPVTLQEPNGVLDLVVEDEAAATTAARRVLACFQGSLDAWDCADQRQLRWSVPEDRLRAYDVRALLRTLVDTDSSIELRPNWGLGMVTAFARIEGRPIGVMANVPTFGGGAIDADGSDKAARFMQLCDGFDIPILSLCDTPGFLVGPEAEKTALVRHTSRLFVTGASLSVPYFTVVLRKGYGLGAMAMARGGFLEPAFTIAWPTGEFGGMGLEGAVRLGYRRELEAVEDAQERQALFDELVAASYERGKALNMAVGLEIDAVVDPVDTRRWVINGLDSMPATAPRSGKKRPFVDTW